VISQKTRRHKPSSKLALACATALLTGCGFADKRDDHSSYRLLASIGISPSYDIGDHPRKLAEYLKKVEETSAEYEKKSDSKGKWQTSFDSTLIGVATGGVAAAFYHASADLIGGFGLAAGALTAYRSYYDPKGGGDIYLRGKFALDCIHANAQPLLIAKPEGLLSTSATESPMQAAQLNQEESDKPNAQDTPHDSARSGIASKPQEGGLWGARVRLAEALGDARITVARLSGTPGEAGTEAGNAAIGAGQSALNALDAEIAAYTVAPTTVANAYNTIVFRVRRANQRSVVDVAAAQQSLSSSISVAAAGAASAAEARAKLLQSVKETSREQVMAGTSNVVTPSSEDTGVAVQTVAPAMQRAQTIGYVAGLNEETERALAQLPVPPFAEIAAKITACSAGL